MFTRIATVALFAITLFSCQTDKEKIIFPPVKLEMTRTVSLPLRNNTQKTASYNEASGLTSNAFIENGKLSITFVADPTTDRVTGDGITFRLNNSQPAALKTYSYDQLSNRIEYTRYTYADHGDETRIRIIDTRMGPTFRGELTITDYDASKKIISGHYFIEIPDLIYDPTKLQPGIIIEPEDESHLTLTGSFRNVRIK